MSNLSYASEKFRLAVDCLAGNGPLQERLHSAYGSFQVIQERNIADEELRAIYADIVARLTTVKSDRGYVPATLEQMSDEEAGNVASLIVELAFAIERQYDGTN